MTARLDRHISCEEVVRTIWDYLDGEADADLTDRIREHLEICPPCRDQYSFESAFLRTVSRVIDDEHDVRFLRSRIVDALREQGFRDTPLLDGE